MSRKVKIILLNTVAVLILVLASLGVYIFLNKNASVDLAYDLEQPQEIGKVYVDKLDNYVVAMARTLSESGEAIVEMKKDRPEVRLKKWDGEVDLGISYKKIKTRGTASLQSNKVVWQAADMSEEVHAYPLSAKRGMEDGGLEIEVVLNSLPQTNVFEFEIDGYEDLDFFYQPMEISEDVRAIVGDDASVPENVKGSYAVYHKTNKDHRVGGINYATGKVFHIYRPKVIDNSGNEVWGVLAYANGVLAVTVPQEFLDQAAYPVRVDPTFGYTSIGAYETVQQSDFLRSQASQVDSLGMIRSVSFYSHTGGNNRNFQGAIYDGVNSKHGDAGATAQVTNLLGWYTSTISSGPGVTSTTDYYYAAILADAASGLNTVSFYYDIVGSKTTFNNTVTFPTWPAGTSEISGIKNSIYATYTETPAVSAGIIISWSGTVAAIPAGWSRVSAFDGEFIEATSTTPLATEYGSATHTHISPTHKHTASHTHTGVSVGTAQGNPMDTTSGGVDLSEDRHSHSASINSASYDNNFTSAVLSYESNDPPYTEVIWIKSDGTVPGLPESSWAFLHTDSLPTGWDRVSTGRFLKGAGTGNDGGATGGTSDAHGHEDTGHTHTEPSHTHTGELSEDETRETGATLKGADMISPHTHALSGGSATATETATSSPGYNIVANSDGQPPFYILNMLQNNTGASSTPTGIIAMWDGAVGNIPDGWEACDGSGTCPDLSDYFIKGATGGGEVGTTQDTNTHTHSSGITHYHTRNSHTHSFTVGSASGLDYGRNGEGFVSVEHNNHTHSVSVSNCGTNCSTGSATVTASANTDNQPLHKDAIFIYFNGVPTITDILDSPDPVSQGSSITFDFDWDDIAGDLIKAKLCKSNGLTNMNCDGGFWASSSVYTNDDPETLFYNTTESDYPQIEWYGYVCDIGGSCSNATSGTTTISLASPAGSGIKLKSGTIKINLDDFKHILFVSFLAPLPFLIRKRKKDD